jgi:ribosomal protein S18 acetylase RimI-like enzyme
MNTEEIKIVNAKPEDIETICEIAVNAWQTIHDGYREYICNDDLYDRISKNWRKKKANSIKTKAKEEPEKVLVAKDADGTIMGFATFTIDIETGIGELGNNAVPPEFQGKGIGKLLYKQIFDIFRKKGILYAIVGTGYEDEGHANARAAYEKAGFKKMRTSVTYSMKL